MRTPEELHRIARHEAAHSIAYTILGAGVKFCDVLDDGEFDGWTQENPCSARDLLSAATCLMAGCASQQIFSGHTLNRAIQNCRRDFQQMFDIAAHLPEQEQKKLFHDARFAAQCFIRQHREQIETLAQELMLCGRVGGDRVREIAECGR